MTLPMTPALPNVQGLMSAARAARAQSAAPHERQVRDELLHEERTRVARIDATPQAASFAGHVAKLEAAGYFIVPNLTEAFR